MSKTQKFIVEITDLTGQFPINEKGLQLGLQHTLPSYTVTVNEIREPTTTQIELGQTTLKKR